MSLTPGTRIGPYEIVSAIGAGGMGEVYRARDARLGREVAIKILPDLFAADADRVERFQRGAQVLASLNHPHIAQGAIPLDEALPIARQITEALEAAHENGIVHRDLKPANIKLTQDGTVKVLDFGLAKTLEHAASGSAVESQAYLSQSPTLTSPAMATNAGVTLGTAVYIAAAMSTC